MAKHRLREEREGPIRLIRLDEPIVRRLIARHVQPRGDTLRILPAKFLVAGLLGGFVLRRED